MDRQLPYGVWSTSGRFNSCKVLQKVGCLTWGITFNRSLMWKKAEVFKLNGDEEDERIAITSFIF